MSRMGGEAGFGVSWSVPLGFHRRMQLAGLKHSWKLGQAGAVPGPVIGGLVVMRGGEELTYESGACSKMEFSPGFPGHQGSTECTLDFNSRP